MDDDDPYIPTGTPVDDDGTPLIPELGGRTPSHNEQVLISGSEVHLGSTNVKSIWWNWKEKRLFVRFLDGSLYAYEGISLDVARGMLETDSPGRYVWNTLRAGGYSYRRLEGGSGGGGKRKAQVIRRH
jgi:hypothetical protein